MKIFKLLALSLLISINCFSQSAENTVNQINNTEENTVSELESLKTLLSLSEEQIEKISNILEGINQKNSQVSDMNLIQEDKDAILERNQQAKAAMIVPVLNEEQKVIYLESVN
tara:strand:- start:45 stop:386 length:342 start_codon:yes stop_codon:yes gene_type:complete